MDRMSLYSNYIFPLLCEFTLNNPIVDEQRRELLAQVEGAVLEIGFGTGLNLPHYPHTIRKITTVDPNAGMSRKAKCRIEQSPIAVEHHQLRSETLPFDEASFDCIVSTFTLCSITDVNRAVKELFRVLKPDGKFLFLEHGLSPDSGVQKWQHRLNRIQRWCGDGCNLNRNIREIVEKLPFSSLELVEMYLEKIPKTHGYVYRGVARK
jgi:ubiquinone/menaquinone biosynthesis C-methylase UbiE